MGKSFIEIEDINLDGGKAEVKTSPEKLTTHYRFYLYHMLRQFSAHGRVGVKMNLNFEETEDRNLWEYAGKKLGNEVGEILKERKDIYGYGFSIVPFGHTLGITSVKVSSKPTAKVILEMSDKDHKKLQPEIEEFFKNFSTEAGIDVFTASFPISKLFTNNGSATYRDGDDHHRIEVCYKSFADAFHYLKSPKGSLTIKPSKGRQRTARKERDTHETKIKLDLNLDGEGKCDIYFESDVPSETVKTFGYSQRCFSKGSRFDQICNETTVSARGDEEHHLIEDYGIVLGEAIDKALGKMKGLMRFGYDIQRCPRCGESVVVATDVSNRPCFDARLYPYSRERQLIGHAIEQLATKAGIDTFIDTHSPPKSWGMDEAIREALYSLFYEKPEYHLPADSIKGGRYTLETDCDSKYHPYELLSVALGRSVRQSTSIDRARLRELPTTKGVF